MTVTITLANDATHNNINALPKGQLGVGYTTGTPDIKWTDQDWIDHSNAVRICQDAAASDDTADEYDVERYAGTNAKAAEWYPRAVNSFNTAKRPGQRFPALYTSMSNVTPLANALNAAGVHFANLHIADWNLTEAQAIADVIGENGPFPAVAMQYTNAGSFDRDVYSTAWLNKRSKAPLPSGVIHGPWVVMGALSIADFARSRNVTVPALLRMTAIHYGGFEPKLANYIGQIFNGTIEPTAHVPAGITFWLD